MRQILVTGGAGYIGSVLVRLLLSEGYKVRVIDRLMYGGEPILDLLNDDNFEFVNGDIRKEADVRRALIGVDYLAHLAAIVGDPACAKEPELTKSTNLEGAKLLYSLAEKMKVKKFIFSSTCSNYGKMDNPESYINEESKLSPVSLYAETKVSFENFLFNQNKTNICKPTILRFSTVYGLSQRPRFDLTVNEFTKELALGRELVIFGGQFWRPYCHVIDLARAVITAIKADAKNIEFDVFNVGDTSENYTKQMLVEEIKKQLPNSQIKYVKKEEDPRDYRVNFDKIKRVLNFRITKTVPDGIQQIIKVIKEGFFVNPDDSKYKNI